MDTTNTINTKATDAKKETVPTKVANTTISTADAKFNAKYEAMLADSREIVTRLKAKNIIPRYASNTLQHYIAVLLIEKYG